MNQGRFDELEGRIKKLESLLEAMLEYTLSLGAASSEKDKTLASPTSRDAQADINPLGANLYASERNASGIQFSWTGPAPITSIPFNIDRSTDATILLDLVAYASDEIKSLTTLYIDGEPATFEQKGTAFLISVPTDKILVGLPTVLLIDTQKTVCPHSAGLGNDKRFLGVAIRVVEVQ
jgi:hypothetical protein